MSINLNCSFPKNACVYQEYLVCHRYYILYLIMTEKIVFDSLYGWTCIRLPRDWIEDFDITGKKEQCSCKRWISSYTPIPNDSGTRERYHCRKIVRKFRNTRTIPRIDLNLMNVAAYNGRNVMIIAANIIKLMIM